MRHDSGTHANGQFCVEACFDENTYPFPICNNGHELRSCDRDGCPEHHPICARWPNSPILRALRPAPYGGKVWHFHADPEDATQEEPCNSAMEA